MSLVISSTQTKISSLFQLYLVSVVHVIKMGPVHKLSLTAEVIAIIILCQLSKGILVTCSFSTTSSLTAKEFAAEKVAIVLQESQILVAKKLHMLIFHFQLHWRIPVDNLKTYSILYSQYNYFGDKIFSKIYFLLKIKNKFGYVSHLGEEKQTYIHIWWQISLQLVFIIYVCRLLSTFYQISQTDRTLHKSFASTEHL